MGKALAIADFDGIFASRAGNAEWARILLLRDLPGLCPALILYDDIMAPFYGNNFILNKVVPEAWRFQMLVFTLHLDDVRDPEDVSTGLTLRNLQRLCAQQQIASPGRVLAYLQIMQLGGYLTRSRSSLDRRIVHLEPSAKLMATVETWNMAIFRLIDCIATEDGLVERAERYPALGSDMRRLSTYRLLDGWEPVGAFPEVMHFVASDGGWMLLARCVAEMLRKGGGQRIVPVAINLAHFSAEFGVSRSHLRRLLESAHQAGLLEAPPRNGAHVLLSPQLVCATLAWFAGYLSNYRSCALEAVANAAVDWGALRPTV